MVALGNLFTDIFTQFPDHIENGDLFYVCGSRLMKPCFVNRLTGAFLLDAYIQKRL